MKDRILGLVSHVRSRLRRCFSCKVRLFVVEILNAMHNTRELLAEGLRTQLGLQKLTLQQFFRILEPE